MITAVMVTVGYKVVSAVEWLMDRLLHLKYVKIPPTSRPPRSTCAGGRFSFPYKRPSGGYARKRAAKC